MLAIFRLKLAALAALLVLPCAGCGNGDDVDIATVSESVPAAGAPLQEPTVVPGSDLSVPVPDRPLRTLALVESVTVLVTDWLEDFGAKVLVRDFDGASAWLAQDFQGSDLFGSASGEARRLPLEARITRCEPDATALDRDAFIESLQERIGPWRRVLESHWRVEEAEFQKEQPLHWGRITLAVKLLGSTESGGRESIDVHGEARVERTETAWTLTHFVAHEIVQREIPEVLFVDVSRSAGVAHEGVRFGLPGNDTDAWNGVACADVDGDGWLDLFVPSGTRNFLYHNTGRGTFDEEADVRGLALPVGGTGAVFFDYDLDGDVDLAVAHVGWERPDRGLGGNRLQLYRNDGKGIFQEVGDELGLALPRVGFSLTAFDYDRDGWVDLFLCGYGRMDRARNDSWIEATNGAPNTLLRNEGGERFVDVTRAAGLDDARWSYGSTAADVDEDGWIDLYVTNNFGSNRLWRNRGDGTFEDAGPELGVSERGNSVAAAFGDVDNDGQLDLYLTGSSSNAGKRILKRLRGVAPEESLSQLFVMANGNALFSRGEKGAFERLDQSGATAAGWAWDAELADFDLDGALDVYCVNGFVTGDLPEDT